MVEPSSDFESKFFIGSIGQNLVKDLVGAGEEKESWECSLTRAIIQLHNGVNRHDEEENFLPDTGKPPEIIYVTATTGIIYGISVKTCWKLAWSTERQPSFYVIDVSDRRFGLDHDNFKRILTDEEVQKLEAQEIEKIKILGEKHKAFNNSVVFDEFPNSGTTLKRTAVLLKQAGYSNINFCAGRWGMPYSWIPNDDERPVIRHPNDELAYRPIVMNITPVSGQLTKDYFTIGRLMANQIKDHNYQA